jgi:hypothetical protein
MARGRVGDTTTTVDKTVLDTKAPVGAGETMDKGESQSADEPKDKKDAKSD